MLRCLLPVCTLPGGSWWKGVAGKATSTSRKDSRVEYRSMVTLDADTPGPGLPARVEEAPEPVVEDAELAVVALDRAAALINAGRSDVVKAALDKVGGSRVSLLEVGQIQEFP